MCVCAYMCSVLPVPYVGVDLVGEVGALCPVTGGGAAFPWRAGVLGSLCLQMRAACGGIRGGKPVLETCFLWPKITKFESGASE